MQRLKNGLIAVLVILSFPSLIRGQADIQRVYSDTLMIMGSRTDTTLRYNYADTFPGNGIWLYNNGVFGPADIDTLTVAGLSATQIPVIGFLDASAFLASGSILDTTLVNGLLVEELFLFNSDPDTESVFIKLAFDTTLFQIDSISIFVSSDSTATDSISYDLQLAEVNEGANPQDATFDVARSASIENAGDSTKQRISFTTGFTAVNPGDTYFFKLTRDTTVTSDMAGMSKFHEMIIHGQAAILVANQTSGLPVVVEDSDVVIVSPLATLNFIGDLLVTQSPTGQANVSVGTLFLDSFTETFFQKAVSAPDSMIHFSWPYDVVVDSAKFTIFHDGGDNDTLRVNFRSSLIPSDNGSSGSGSLLMTSNLDVTSNASQTVTSFNDPNVARNEFLSLFSSEEVGNVVGLNVVLFLRRE
jgi:hypothetical protein